MAIQYTYVGKGGFISGVPAHSLSREEYDRLSEDQKKAVRESGLYEAAKGEAREAEPYEDITKGGAGGTKRVIAAAGAYVPPELADRVVPAEKVEQVLAGKALEAAQAQPETSAITPDVPLVVVEEPADEASNGSSGRAAKKGGRS